MIPKRIQTHSKKHIKDTTKDNISAVMYTIETELKAQKMKAGLLKRKGLAIKGTTEQTVICLEFRLVAVSFQIR